MGKNNMILEMNKDFYDECVKQLSKNKESMYNSKNNFDAILKSISNDWKSDSATAFNNDLKNSVAMFDSYMKSYDFIIKYLNENYEEFKQVQNTTSKASANSLGKNGGA